ncbi:MAG TPA: hypothetical protein VGO65_04825 [Pseudolysinimonas sp.]|nr:hypothetical protein [Pseudolysinimonas sp.]
MEDLSDLWSLAAREDLTPAQVERLLADGREPVLTTLAQNASISADVIERLADGGGSVRDSAVLNPNAPAALKETVAPWQHTTQALMNYLDEKNASVSERAVILASQGEQGTETLGEVWARAHGA